MRFRFKRVCSSAWLERTPDKGEVGGSSPPRPTNLVDYRHAPFLTAINISIPNKIMAPAEE